MAQGLELIDQILILVCDRFQVVSYKWLSRKFSIPSNLAKRLLQKFVDQHGDDVEVVYSVSGWTKTAPGCYTVQLVPKAKLQQAKQLLADPVNSHVYSVQPCLPKDPAELWSAEYVQAEELFNEPPDRVNCLRDNRFSAISCVSVTRDLKGKNHHTGPSLSSKPPSAPVSMGGTEKPPVAQAQMQMSSPPGASVPVAANVSTTPASSKPMEVDLRDGLTGRPSNASGAQTGASVKGAVAPPVKKKTTVPAGQGGALASLWGRASSKPKPTSPKGKVGTAGQQPPSSASGDAEARIRALEAACDASSDDDAEDFAHMCRGRLRNVNAGKRHVVFEDEVSDAAEEETFGPEMVVSLASPEVSKERNDLVSKPGQDDQERSSVCGNTQVCLQGKENFPFIAKDEEKKPCNVAGNGMYIGPIDAKFKAVIGPKAEVVSKDKSIDLIDSRGAGEQVKEKGNVMPRVVRENIAETNTGPKKRKVLKTHIDDHGREVSSVVWEVEGAVLGAVDLQQTETNIAPAKIQQLRQKMPAAAKGANTSQSLPSKGSSKSSGKSVGKNSQEKILSFFKKKN